MTTPSSASQSRGGALLDLLLIIGVLVGLKTLLLQSEIVWSFAGPISLLVALAVATWRLRQRNETWAGLGLGMPRSIGWTALWTLVALIVTIAVGIVAESLAAGLIGAPDEATQAIDARHQGRFDNVPGNLPVFLFWLAISWVIGGFTEEMLFRGALLTRFERMFRGIPAGAVLAALSQGILFGQQHFYYQGIAGWVATGAIGFVSGLLYLCFKRNLWPLVISHGLGNTLGLTLLYLGAMG